MGRTDDIINVAGHRLSTGGMEEVLAAHPDVAECAVIGVKDELKGEVPCGFVVLKSGVTRAPAEIEKEIVALVREKIGPVAAFKLAVTVARLPKTRSGKILRGTMKKIADGEEWNMPATIDDPAMLDEIGGALKEKGVGVELGASKLSFITNSNQLEHERQSRASWNWRPGDRHRSVMDARRRCRQLVEALGVRHRPCDEGGRSTGRGAEGDRAEFRQVAHQADRPDRGP